MVRSAANLESIAFGYQVDFKTPAPATALTWLPGSNTKLTGFETMNNQMPLPQLGQNEIQSFAYGKDSKKISLEWVMSSPWFLSGIFGKPSASISAAPPTGNTAETAASGTVPASHYYTASRYKKSIPVTVNMIFDGESNKLYRRLVGCVFTNVSVKSTMDNYVTVTADLLCGRETLRGASNEATVPPQLPTAAAASGVADTGVASSVAIAPTAIGDDALDTPYTFIDGSIFLGGSALNQVMEVQTFDFTLNPNNNLLYTHGSSEAQSAYKKITEYTGKMNASLLSRDNINRVLARTDKSGATDLRFRAKFQRKSSTGKDEESVELTFSGVSFHTHSVGFQEAEPVFEDLSWQARTLQVACLTGQTSNANRFSPIV